MIMNIKLKNVIKKKLIRVMLENYPEYNAEGARISV